MLTYNFKQERFYADMPEEVANYIFNLASDGDCDIFTEHVEATANNVLDNIRETTPISGRDVENWLSWEDCEDVEDLHVQYHDMINNAPAFFNEIYSWAWDTARKEGGDDVKKVVASLTHLFNKYVSDEWDSFVNEVMMDVNNGLKEVIKDMIGNENDD